MTFALTLNDIVTIKKPTTGQDDIGAPLATWVDYDVNVWANVKHLRGVQAIKAGSDMSKVQCSIRLRYREDLDASMRVVSEGTNYDVRAVLPDGGKVFVDLVCEVVT
jgi:SPP1 family predicted phage head-tail adaptor